MKVSYGEGVATHTGPESCGVVRKGSVEALTGVRAGRVSSRERNSLRGADAVKESGRQHRDCLDMARDRRTLRGRRPRARTEAPRARTGRSVACPCERAVSRSPRTYADDERATEVGPRRSTAEVSEQSRICGGAGGGGKGAGRREPARAKRAPDTVPGRRAQCARAGTSSSKER